MNRLSNTHLELVAFIRPLLDTLHFGVVLADMHGSFIAWNERARKILQISNKRAGSIYWSDFDSFFYPDTITPVGIQRLPMIWVPRGFEYAYLEIFYRHPDVPYGHALGLAARPLLDRSHDLQGSIVVFDTVFNHFPIEQSHPAKRYHFSPSMRFTIDTESACILSCDERAAAFLELSPQDVIGRVFFDCCHPEYRSEARKAFRALLQQQQLTDLTMPLLIGSGLTKEVMLSAKLVSHQPQGIEYYECWATDIRFDLLTRQIGKAFASISLTSMDNFAL